MKTAEELRLEAYQRELDRMREENEFYADITAVAVTGAVVVVLLVLLLT